MADDLETIKDAFAKRMFGMTASEARARRVCISCKKSIDERIMRPIDVAEYRISALCPSCFEEITCMR